MSLQGKDENFGWSIKGTWSKLLDKDSLSLEFCRFLPSYYFLEQCPQWDFFSLWRGCNACLIYKKQLIWILKFLFHFNENLFEKFESGGKSDFKKLLVDYASSSSLTQNFQPSKIWHSKTKERHKISSNSLLKRLSN